QNEFGTREQKKSAHEKKPKKPKQFQYPQEFEDLWALRPRRDGGNPKRQAFNAYKARLREGHTHDEMLEGMLRYAKHQEAAGNIDTPYVQQLATFFGPSLAFTESWDIKPKKSRGNDFNPVEYVNRNRISRNQNTGDRDVIEHGEPLDAAPQKTRRGITYEPPF